MFLVLFQIRLEDMFSITSKYLLSTKNLGSKSQNQLPQHLLVMLPLISSTPHYLDHCHLVRLPLLVVFLLGHHLCNSPLILLYGTCKMKWWWFRPPLWTLVMLIVNKSLGQMMSDDRRPRLRPEVKLWPSDPWSSTLPLDHDNQWSVFQWPWRLAVS